MQLHKVAFIGAGNMAYAIITGLIKAGYPADKIAASNPSADKLNHLAQQYNIHTSHDNCAVLADAQVVVLAVKPQRLKQVIKEIAPTLAQKKPLLISLASGVTLAQINQWLACDLITIRAMPNTPALIGQGLTGLCAASSISELLKKEVDNLFKSVGMTVWLKNEDELDRLAAIAGSGPAYLFLVMEAWQQAGEKLGLENSLVKSMVIQTVIGAAELAKSSQQEFPELRRAVTSPGGITEQAIARLETANIREAFAEALQAAVNHSKKMSEQSESN